MSTKTTGQVIGAKLVMGKPLDPDEQVKQFVLERFEITDFAGPPNAAGCYIICIRRRIRKNSQKYGPELVMYIGSSQNIKERFNDPFHPLHALREQEVWPNVVFSRTLLCQDYRRKEIQLIKLFRPPLNVTHNG